jgi:hypothetical protein
MFGKKGSWLIVALLVALAAFAAPPASAAGLRLVAELDEPFEACGVLFPPGTVSLQQVNGFSPTSTLNEIRVDGRSLGLVLAREEASSYASPRNELIFERNESGRLVLAGVARKGEPVRRLYAVGPVAAEDWTRSAPDARPLVAALP